MELRTAGIPKSLIKQNQVSSIVFLAHITDLSIVNSLYILYVLNARNTTFFHHTIRKVEQIGMFQKFLKCFSKKLVTFADLFLLFI